MSAAHLVQVKLLDPRGRVPSTSLHGDVGYDLSIIGDHTLRPGEAIDIPTGVAIAMDNRIYGRITGRSSSARKGLLVSEGILDSGYRGELFIHVRNVNGHTITLEEGMRLGQLIFAWAVRPGMMPVDELPPSDRGAKGFGSTGA